MNIFYISSSSFPSRRANAVHVMNMCKALNNLNHSVTLFIRSESKDCKNYIFDNFEINSKLIMHPAGHPSIIPPIAFP